MEPPDEDALLLRRFLAERSDEAFSQLVARKINLVYSSALRQVGGDSHLAAEVTQSVFIALARQAGKLRSASNITGWLYQSTAFESKKLWRSQTRWRDRQRQGQAMHELTQTGSATSDWEEIRPLIDKAMAGLSDDDRTVVLARYFEGASFAAIGGLLNLPENTARMRAERALQKLRGRLGRRGVTSTASALSAALTAGAVTAAPAALAGTVSANALAVAGTALAASTQSFVFLAMKKQLLVLGVLALSAGSFFAGRYQVLAQRAAPAPQTPRVQPKLTGAALPMQPSRTVQPGSSTSGAPAAAASAGVEAVGTVETLRVLVDLQKRGIFKNPSEIVRYGKLDPRFASLYGLTPDEAAAFQQILDSAHERLAALTQANARVTTQDASHVVIKIAPFPQDGGSLYDGTSASIAAVLGPDRMAAFQQLSEGSLENEFSSFGAADRTVTVTRAGSADNPYSVVEDHWVQSVDGNTTSSTSTYNLKTGDDIARLGLGSSLPGTFQQLPTNPDKVAGGSHSSVASSSH